MKEIIIAAILIVLVSVGASFMLDNMNWSADAKYTTTNVRL